MLAWHDAGLRQHQRPPGPSFRRVGQGDQELRRRHVRLAAPCGLRTDALLARRRAAPTPTSTRSIISTSRARRSRASAAACSPGRTVWATDRCSPGTTPRCANTNVHPVHHFDESGKEIKSFGGGMFAWPHGIHVDRDGNVWVTDARADPATNKGSVVVKFSPDGKV